MLDVLSCKPRAFVNYPILSVISEKVSKNSIFRGSRDDDQEQEERVFYLDMVPYYNHGYHGRVNHYYLNAVQLLFYSTSFFTNYTSTIARYSNYSVEVRFLIERQKRVAPGGGSNPRDIIFRFSNKHDGTRR